MQRSDIYTKIITIVSPYCKNQDGLANINEKSNFFDDLEINSARLVDIILSLEEEFKISIDDASAEKIKTIGDAVNLVVDKNN